MDTFDIVAALVETHDLTLVVRDIFALLDLKDLENCTKVCRYWKNFIKYHFCESPWGKSYFHRQLFINPVFVDEPKSIETVMPNYGTASLLDLQCDKSGGLIVVSSEYGFLVAYDAITLEQKWIQRFGDRGFQLSMGGKVIVCVTDGEPRIFVVDKFTGELIQDVHPDEEIAHSEGINGVAQFDNRLLATCSSDQVIKFYTMNLEGETSEVVRLMKNVQCHGNEGFTHLHNQESLLMSGAINGDLCLWEFSTGELLQSLNCGFQIMSLTLHWPYVAVCSNLCTEKVNDPKNFGVKIYDLEKCALVRLLPVGSAHHVLINEHFVMACLDSHVWSFKPKNVSFDIWLKEEVVNSRVPTNSLRKKSFVIDDLDPKAATLVGDFTDTSLITIEGWVFKKRTIWAKDNQLTQQFFTSTMP